MTWHANNPTTRKEAKRNSKRTLKNFRRGKGEMLITLIGSFVSSSPFMLDLINFLKRDCKKFSLMRESLLKGSGRLRF